MSTMMIVIDLEVRKLSLQIIDIPEQGVIKKLTEDMPISRSTKG